ncbi:alpha/beta hydrolase [Daejeonella sp.]|uniref:alpha/beta hydrolase n=1 Tax=Daejeonella sp. TaxID=2805397 RepID=UPI0030BE6DC6
MRGLYFKSIIPGIIFAFTTHYCAAQKVIKLYPGTTPNQKITTGEADTSNQDKSVFNRVSNPTLTLYPGNKTSAKKTAVIICAGGGYAELNIKREGYAIAEAFNKKGIAAFVLKYRLSDDKSNSDKSIAPLQDAQQAIKVVRDSAEKWKIDPHKIGIMGFSAGGHLAASLGSHYNDALINNPSKTNLRPDFMLLIYPVISFRELFGHIGSRDNLLSKSPSRESVDYFSNELHVNKQTPATFLVHAGDDKIVSVVNSLKYYEELQKSSVVADLHIYAKGGHGFSIVPAFDEWFGRCILWLSNI